MKNFITRLKSESGATSVEYAFVAGLIFAVCIAGISAFGLATGKQMQDNATQIEASLK